MTDAVTHVIQTDMRARFSVSIVQGKTPKLEVDAPADVLDRISTRVSGERLTITSIPGSDADRETTGKVAVQVTVTLTSKCIFGALFNCVKPIDCILIDAYPKSNRHHTDLTAVDVMGPGETSIAGFDLDALSIDAAGGGKTTFDGKANTLRVRTAGAGDAVLKSPASFTAETLEGDILGTGSLDASAFKAANVNLNMAGTSDVSVHATKSVTVRGAGTGDLTVAGNPEQRNVHLFGTGKVDWKRMLRA